MSASTGSSLRATDVIRLALIETEEDAQNEAKFFKPLFTHQIFENELIEGHTKPIIDLIYNASNLQLCLHLVPDPTKDAHTVTDLAEPFSRLIVHPYESSVSAILSPNANKPPVGSKVHEYTPETLHISPQDSKSNESSAPVGSITYEVYTSNFSDPAFVQFHRRMQIFNLFFIDGASYIDETDEKWQAFTLFERRESGGDVTYSFMGFTTVYHFFAFPEHTRSRVSQFLILPPHQRKGHALQLLQAVRQQCVANPSCRDLLVEDPTQEFQNIRLLVEMLDCGRKKIFDFDVEKEAHRHWETLSKEDIAAVSQELRIGRDSVLRLYLIFRQKAIGPLASENKPFRLRAKAYLSKKNEDELEGLDADARKARLHQLFEELVEANNALIRRYKVLA